MTEEKQKNFTFWYHIVIIYLAGRFDWSKMKNLKVLCCVSNMQEFVGKSLSNSKHLQCTDIFTSTTVHLPSSSCLRMHRRNLATRAIEVCDPITNSLTMLPQPQDNEKRRNHAIPYCGSRIKNNSTKSTVFW